LVELELAVAFDVDTERHPTSEAEDDPLAGMGDVELERRRGARRGEPGLAVGGGDED
jgi:hypothetical protein